MKKFKCRCIKHDSSGNVTLRSSVQKYFKCKRICIANTVQNKSDLQTAIKNAK